MFDVEGVQSAESIYRKYVEAAVRIIQESLISPETLLVHLSPLSDRYDAGYAESIPIEENILYALLLLRMKTQESVLLAKKQLTILLRYQNNDGSFPVTVTEFGTVSDWTPSFRMLVPFVQILIDFQSVLGSDICYAIESACEKLFSWCSACIDIPVNFKNPLHSFLFASIGIKKYPDAHPHDRYLLLCQEAIQQFTARNWSFDMSLLGSIAPFLLENSNIKRILSQAASMWEDYIGYTGPALATEQSGFMKGIQSGDIALSLLHCLQLKIKAENWPRRSLFSIATLYSLCDIQFSVEKVVEKQTNTWGYSCSLSGKHLSWIIEKEVSKKQFFPISILSGSTDLVVTGKGYSLVSCNQRGDRNFIFQFDRIGDVDLENGIQKRDAPQLLSFYLTKNNLSMFLDVHGVSATYFNAQESIIIGRRGDQLEGALCIAIEPQVEEPLGYSFRIRSEERPNQIKSISPHIGRSRKLGHNKAHDWVLEYVHSQGVKPSQIILSIIFV